VLGHHEHHLTDEEKELEKTGITIIAIDKDRTLHVLDQEDVKLLKLMKTWKEKHKPTLEELIDKFGMSTTTHSYFHGWPSICHRNSKIFPSQTPPFITYFVI